MKHPLKDLGSLRISNTSALIPAALAYADEIAALAGFLADDRKKMRLALEEACLNVIEHSFGQDEEGEFDIRFQQNLNRLEVHLHDMGLPYNPDDIPKYNPAADLHAQDLGGLGTHLIRKIVDEYQYNNLGVRGKEMVLIKYFNTPELVPDRVVPNEPEVVEPPKTGLHAEQIEFQIRRMKPEEAVEVCRCVYDCYGYSYANENIYFPERVAAMNHDGRLLSSVAVTQDGDMGGHFALIYYDNLPAEIGIAVTKKKFRGHGFARQLGEFLEEEALKQGLRGLQVKEVTAHPYTQKFCIKLGYNDCGLLLAHSPKSLSFKGIADTLKQRNSDVLGFKYLTTPLPREIYAPLHHRSMIAHLYSNIGDQVTSILSSDPKPAGEQCSIEVKVHNLRSMAEIFVAESGPDTMLALRTEMRKVFMDEIQVIELYLSLADPMTPQYVPQLENLGFVFTGILPETSQGDSIILQYFNGVHIDYDQIVLVTDVAKQLLEYVRKNDPHAG
jgi:anti-sigma regulatory factor (Ser/Thr protein kinase)/GNAT superfamily N-acetyltransferase